MYRGGRGLAGTLLIMVATAAYVPAAPSAPVVDRPTVVLDDVVRVDIVRVRVTMRNDTPRPIVVPWCEKDAGGTENLCFGSSRLEVRTKRGWGVPSPPSEGSLPGGRPMQGTRTIGPRRVATFSYQVALRGSGLKPGQTARLSLDAWNDEDSIRKVPPPVTLQTAAFTIPLQ